MKAEEFLKKRFKTRHAVELPEIGGFSLLYLLTEFEEQQNKELVLCLENSTKIMEDQEGEVMDLVICDTMNHQIKWNKETMKTKKK